MLGMLPLTYAYNALFVESLLFCQSKLRVIFNSLIVVGGELACHCKFYVIVDFLVCS